jgi:hypothetical protein
MKTISAKEAQVKSVDRLGLDSTALDLGSPEALATLIRRIASIACPCAPSELAATAIELLEPLVESESLSDVVADTLEALTAYGDLIESREITGRANGRIIYLAPPSFIEVSPKMFLLLGGGPDGSFPIPEDLFPACETTTYYRRLWVLNPDEASRALLQAGFLKLEADSWLKLPPASSASSLVSNYDALLTSTARAGSLEELSLLDHAANVKYYRGRWQKLKRQTGRFVARRPQAYGADLWCYLELQDGVAIHMLDFPVKEVRWRPCDEAWHLLQAIDATLGKPQRYRVRPGPKAQMTLDFFSPVPLWATRRWNFVGSRVLSTGCLFSYAFPETQVAKEVEFLRERMWLEQL